MLSFNEMYILHPFRLGKSSFFLNEMYILYPFRLGKSSFLLLVVSG